MSRVVRKETPNKYSRLGLRDCSLSTILPRPSSLLKMFWFMPMGNIPQWEKEKIRSEQDVSLEK